MHVPVYYVVPTTPPIIMADARTDRVFVAPTTDKAATGDASVIVHSHRDDQIMSDTQFDWLKAQVQKSELPILVTSVPLLQTLIGDRVLRLVRPEPHQDLLRGAQKNADSFEFNLRDLDADTWCAYPKSVERILAMLSSETAVIWLGGDVHFSYLFDVAGFAYRDPKGAIVRAKTRIVHAVSSGFEKQLSTTDSEKVYRYGGRSVVNPKSGDPELEFGVPASDPIRDPFDLPESVWPTGDNVRYPHARYSTQNTIGVILLGKPHRCEFWQKNEDPKSAEPMVRIVGAQLKIVQ